MKQHAYMRAPAIPRFKGKHSPDGEDDAYGNSDRGH